MSTTFRAKQLWGQMKNLTVRIDNYLFHAFGDEDDKINDNSGDYDYIRAESPLNRD